MSELINRLINTVYSLQGNGSTRKHGLWRRTVLAVSRDLACEPGAAQIDDTLANSSRGLDTTSRWKIRVSNDPGDVCKSMLTKGECGRANRQQA